MPIPYFLFLKGVTQRGARAFYLLSILHILNVFLISFLYLTGIMGLENSLAITIVIMTVSVLILLSILYRNFKRAPQAKVVFAASLLFFLIIALLCANIDMERLCAVMPCKLIGILGVLVIHSVE